MAIATDGCNVTDRHNFLAQKLDAKIVRMVSVHCHEHRLVSACYYVAADMYSLVYETAKALSCNYRSVLMFHRCGRLPWRCIRLQWRQKACSCSAHAKQGVCRVRQWWKQGVRFWPFGPHWRRCQKIKMMAMCVALRRLMKTKNVQHGAFLLPTLLPHLAELSNVFQAGYFNFAQAQMKASVELCINVQ